LVLFREVYMGKELYVGNLVSNITNDTLRAMFEAYGVVIAAQIGTHSDTGRSKGFAFVQMDSDQEAWAAIKGLNGKQVKGRRLTVSEARILKDSGRANCGGRSGPGSGGYGGGRGSSVRHT
jgi:RNA recognition motif-containing protein